MNDVTIKEELIDDITIKEELIDDITIKEEPIDDITIKEEPMDEDTEINQQPENKKAGTLLTRGDSIKFWFISSKRGYNHQGCIYLHNVRCDL